MKNTTYEDLLNKFSKFGKVEVFIEAPESVEVKITDGFKDEYEPTMVVGELLLSNYPRFKNITIAIRKKAYYTIK